MKTEYANSQAQAFARRTLLEKYREEYNELYRAEVIRLGGKVRPSKQEKIEKLKAQLAELEAN